MDTHLVPQQNAIHYYWEKASINELGEIHSEGWAVCPSGVANVFLYLDGALLGKAAVGLPRPDVGEHFAAISMAGSAGFRFHQSVPHLTPGQHEMRLVIRSVPGNERSEVKKLHTVNATVEIAPAPSPPVSEIPEFLLRLDHPRVVHGAAVEPVFGALTIDGWALSRSGISRIEVCLDDVALGAAQSGLPRPDVGIAYPDWHQAVHSGYSFHVPTDVLHEGQNLIKIIIHAQNGQEFIEHFRVDVRLSEDVTDLLGISASPGDSTTKFAQILPTLLPILIDHVHRTVLCRPADPAELDRYVHLLTSGEINLGGMVNSIYECTEYRTLVGPVIEEIRSAYGLLFEREPTAVEIYNHAQAFRSTCSGDDEAASLLLLKGAARSRLAIRPLKIEMDITNQCNIRCIMCSFSDTSIGNRKRSDLPKEVFSRWADEMFAWAQHVGLLFGAEPTLNPNLLDFVKISKEYRVPNVYFSTNAMKLTPKLTAGLLEAGLDEINVSLDAGTKETFERIRRGAKWDTVIGNLKALRDQKAALKLHRPRLHMSFVLMKSNVQELPQFVEIAAEMGAEVLYFSHMVSFDRLGLMNESLGEHLDDYKIHVDRSLALARQHGINVVLPRTRQVGVNFTAPFASSEEHHSNHLAQVDQARKSHGLPRRFAQDEAGSCCPFPWHFLGIDPQGSVFPCGWWHTGPPLGNLHTQSFQEVWSGEPRRTLREQLTGRHLGANCARCPAAGMGSADSAASYQPR